MSCLARLQLKCTPNTTKNTAHAHTNTKKAGTAHHLSALGPQALADEHAGVGDATCCAGVIISVQVASLTPMGIHLEDGLLIPSMCIFLNGTVFLWDPPVSVTAVRSPSVLCTARRLMAPANHLHK
ncbi:hypothetical protein DFH08DRAFT_947732 [Mycena albidolilacea]|uniref:Uncharacterized protein n=1 Tax=Mycena albidolilacea TaxID=1033008 RepID=A0AAD7F6T5_9AGAR|nr:hypothetical protein DFH08DRAFT_947732 [Mycena albidolilacea]